MNPVEIVTIKNKLPLYKGTEEASKIELIELEEIGFELVAGKELYSINDKAVFIQPDYCLPDIELFDSFLRPNGDESKSMLGKVNGSPRRIRAKKFNFHKGDSNPVYSNGILLPMSEVLNYLVKNNHTIENDEDLTKYLGIFKYEEPETTDKKGNVVNGNKPWPSGIYKTDETNINNLWGHIENKIQYPVYLIGTEKIDGSSISIGVLENKNFIGSRNMVKPFTIKKHAGRRNKTLLERILFWTKPDLNIYILENNDNDDFIKYGKPYLDKLNHYGYNNIILRGELNGGSLKGSGNKNNPASKEQPNIKFFGIDVIQKGIAHKLGNEDYNDVVTKLELPTTKVVFQKMFNSRQEIEQACNDYFKNNLIEGIVIRTVDNQFSAKFMNLEYDSKK